MKGFKLGKSVDMGVGQFPKSDKDPKGKGQGPINKTKGQVYGNSTGVVRKDMK